jgi:hypothetical protein
MDGFVERMDMAELGFERAEAAERGGRVMIRGIC